MKVLIIDDSIVFTTTLGEMFTAFFQGVEIIIAENIEDPYTYLQDPTFTHVLLDHDLWNGFKGDQLFNNLSDGLKSKVYGISSEFQSYIPTERYLGKEWENIFSTLKNEQLKDLSSENDEGSIN